MSDLGPNQPSPPDSNPKRTVILVALILVVGVGAAWSIYRFAPEPIPKASKPAQASTITANQKPSRPRKTDDFRTHVDRVEEEKARAIARIDEEHESEIQEARELLKRLNADWLKREAQQLADREINAKPGGVASVEGCSIIADDKQYLGLISRSEFEVDSILNEFGKYGSTFSSRSIFNEFGKYGGKFSLQSPFNDFTLSPPKIFTPDGDFVAYLTLNKAMSPRVDPYTLIVHLRLPNRRFAP